MKKWLCVALCLALCLGCAACGETPEPVETTAPTETTAPPAETKPALFEGNSLKILAIGNSFSNDTTEFLYDIAQAEGLTDIVIGRLFIGSCSLERHAGNAQSGKAEYDYYKNTTGKWVKTENATLLQGIQDEDWDIITMQQSSGKSGQPDTYGTYLKQLIDYVQANRTNPNAKLVWHMTWAYQADSTHADFAKYGGDQMTMYNAILGAVQDQIMPNENFVAVIPAGTAVQNARTTFFGDNMTRDGYHLSFIGRMVASYTWYAVLTGVVPEAIHLEKTITGIALSDGMRSVILESVTNAIRQPYAITQSTLTA